MNVSIIICTRNRGGELKKTLEAIKDVLVPEKICVELIIVDNGSTDITARVAKDFNILSMRVRYVFEKELGQVMARNTGIEASRGDFILFLDDDVRPVADWLIEMIKTLTTSECEVCAGSVKIAPHLLRPWMNPRHRAWLASTDGIDPNRLSFVTGANFGFSKSVLDKVPRFDPELGPGRLGFWDDCLFSLQLKRAGFRFAMASLAVVEHHFLEDRLSRGAFLSRARNEGRSIGYVAWHWDHDPSERLLYIRSLKKRIRLSALRLIRHRDCRQVEGAPDWELNLLSQIGYLEQFASEQRRPRLYEKHGLRKLRCSES